MKVLGIDEAEFWGVLGIGEDEVGVLGTDEAEFGLMKMSFGEFWGLVKMSVLGSFGDQ